MPRRRNTELHINHERWLVSYADFITLLFAFFVVMYSISQVNEGKYKVLSATLEHAFQSPARSTPVTATGITPVQSTSSQLIDLQGRTDSADTSLIPLERAFNEAFGDLIESGLMQISSNEMWLQIELRDSILFPSGSAEASQQARDIFTEVSVLLSGVDHPVQIEGFTDNVPISNERFPSNWELSASRASAIVKWMVERGIDPKRLSAVGYGEHQPIASNDTPEGRAQNRRVAIMISRHKRDRPVAPPGGFSGPASEPAVPTQPTARESEPEVSAPTNRGQMRTIELEDGNLLFSSDPDLPRNDR